MLETFCTLRYNRQYSVRPKLRRKVIINYSVFAYCTKIKKPVSSIFEYIIQKTITDLR